MIQNLSLAVQVLIICDSAFRVDRSVEGLSSHEYSQSRIVDEVTWSLNNSPRSRNDGPFHHNFWMVISCGPNPRDTRSAGFMFDGTCFHWQSSVNGCTFETRLATNVFRRFAGVANHERATLESV
ncbi:hypothetical protein JTE90_007090 [Oedothorax gibbosus]|uniref:Uncharacterized protein n=1 Tax=Oedothorax gibbosus TaxID=931172 RepID=A0AAV6VQ69_9ARAC|nr:hypothetical protein JTE90_007090 [Oedothorax gibbosus]